MKYSENNKPLVCMQTQSTCYKGTSTMTIKGVLWHSTGANNPNLKRYVQPSDNAPDREEWLKLLGVNNNKNDWNHIERQAGLNAWIGKLSDGSVTTVQTMPWNYKPWGCGSGSKGSCNNGWIQFEICEDGLADKNYFNKVYNEACELTAYLFKLYNIDPKGTVTINGVKVPTILCHYDSYKLGFGSNHGDVSHWFSKFGKTMDDVKTDVEKLLNENKEEKPIIPPKKEIILELFRVRKSWEDSESQVGAYSLLTKAIEACNEAGPEYEVYNLKGVAVYPQKLTEENNFKVGDIVKLKSNATYTSGLEIPKWVFNTKLYIKGISRSGNCMIAGSMRGKVIGEVRQYNLIKYNEIVINPKFIPYLVLVTVNVLNVRERPGTQYPIVTQVKKNDIYTIVEESGNWGRLKSGAGWICLDHTKKLKG